MPIPLNAVVVKQEMDPRDIIDFIANCYDTSDPDKPPLLETGETISSYVLTMSAEGAALGVTIETVAPRASALINSDTAIRYWLSVTSGFQANAAFDGVGTKIPVSVEISTNQNRRRERTMVIQVAQQ
jgi:hypothetical protein